MRLFSFTAPLALALATGAVHAATALDPELAIRRELATPGEGAQTPQASAVLVGDADSFARTSRYLGLLYTGNISMARDCNSPDVPKGPEDRCITLPADATLTSFDLSDLGRVTLPARSTNSLLCHWLTANGAYTLQNSGAARVDARMYLRPYVVVESAALADPTWIDPNTGLPFGGRLESSFSSSHLDQRTLDPGERVFVSDLPSRTCQSGFVSKRYLAQAYGLSDAQAAAIFRGEVTLRFGLRGSVRSVASAILLYGLRIMGD
jgi:hypothetical protein